VAANVTLTDANLQYTNFTVNRDVTLTVPSGTVLRCTGTFTNNGTIAVSPGAQGSDQCGSLSSMDTNYAPAMAGVSLRAAGIGEMGDNTTTRFAGFGGTGLSTFQARQVLRPGIAAGGGGAATHCVTGGDGGGSLVVLANAGLANNGTIHADGAGGLTRAAGGGGGIVILASLGLMTNPGTITAVGGPGGASDSFGGAGGGGGGGIIHFLAPSVNNTGTTNVAGGASGTAGAAGSVTANPRQGGSGGGATAGSGGFGGPVGGGAAGNPFPASPGTAGLVLIDQLDPTSLF